MSTRGTRVAYDYIQALAWVGIIVAAVIDFFNSSGKMGKGVDLAADISWAVMNLLIAVYALMHYRRHWGVPVALGAISSVAVVLALFAEYGLDSGVFVGNLATGLNLAITVLHLVLQFRYFSREVAGEEAIVELAPELKALAAEKEQALAAGAQRQYDVAMNLLGRATAMHTSTHGSRPHYDAALDLLEHAWAENQSIQAKYQITQIYEGRYVEAWADKKEALLHYRELLKYFNGKEYRSLDRDDKKQYEKIEKTVRKRIG